MMAIALSLFGCEGTLQQGEDASKRPDPSTTPEETPLLGDSGSSMSEGDMGAEADADGTPQIPDEPTWDTTDCAVPQPGMYSMRRLTKREYLNVLESFFGERWDTFNAKGGRRELKLPSDATIKALDNNAEAQSWTTSRTLTYLLAAEHIADFARQNSHTRDHFVPCLKNDRTEEHLAEEPSCLRDFITKRGALLWRRPLLAEEIEELVAFYATSREQLSEAPLDPPLSERDVAHLAYSQTLSKMLMAPPFLYQLDFGQPSAAAPNGAFPLADGEVARRLAMLMTGQGPDEALQAAADAGELHTEAQIRAQVDRLWETPQGRYGVLDFLTQWLEIDKNPPGKRNDYVLVGGEHVFGPQIDHHERVGDDPRRALRATVSLFVQQEEPTLARLLTSNEALVNDTIAPFYGLEPTGQEGYYGVTLDPSERAGILTHMGWGMAHSDDRNISPTFRGLFITKNLLCRPVALPPADLLTDPPAPRSNLSPRQNFERQVSEPACVSCHSDFDPFGYALDQYDYMGRFRQTYSDYNSVGPDYAIDAAVSVTLDGATRQIDGGVELMNQLASSVEVHQCAVDHWFSYATGRVPQVDWEARSGGDFCTAERLRERFTESQGDLRELLIATALSDAFLYLPPSLDTEEN